MDGKHTSAIEKNTWRILETFLVKLKKRKWDIYSYQNYTRGVVWNEQFELLNDFVSEIYSLILLTTAVEIGDWKLNRSIFIETIDALVIG